MQNDLDGKNGKISIPALRRHFICTSGRNVMQRKPLHHIINQPLTTAGDVSEFITYSAPDPFPHETNKYVHVEGPSSRLVMSKQSNMTSMDICTVNRLPTERE